MEPAPGMNELTRKVIGAAIEVHKVLGPGYQEGVYEEALAFELIQVGVEFERQKCFSLAYKGHPVGEGRIDFLVEGRLVVELKAVEKMQSIHKAQIISYLKATSCQLGLLINFNESMLRNGVQRIVYTDPLRLSVSAANN